MPNDAEKYLNLFTKKELIIIMQDLVKILTPAQFEIIDDYLYQIIVMRDPNVNIKWEKA